MNFSKPLWDAGWRLVSLHQLTHYLYKSNLSRVIALFIWQFEILLSSCHFSPKAIVHRSTKLPHPTGIVIGDGVVIEDEVVIYQNVTIGRKSNKIDAYPIIKSRVTIYANAIIVGDVVIGQGATIGAGAFVSRSIAENEKVGPLQVLV